jgi:dimethylsulfoniopropionate demethylase
MMSMTQSLMLNNRIRQTPFTQRVNEAGAKAYTVYNHTLLPLMFESVAADYRHLKQHVQLWDVSCQRQVEVSGPDAAELVQLLTPRDISKATIGRCMYAPLVDEAGGVVNDPVVLKLAEDRFWLSIADADIGLWVSGLARPFDVTVTEPDVSPLAVQGPKADELMARVFGPAVHDIKFFRFAELDFHGHPLIVARTGWSKQGGFEIYLDAPTLGLTLWDELAEAGADLSVRAGCPNTIERIEAGLLSYGADMTRENNPFECNFDPFINLDRPIEFLGREALETVAATGPERRIVGLQIKSLDLPPCIERWTVWTKDRAVGCVTSAAISPDIGSGIALAMVDRSHWDPGTLLDVWLPDGRPVAATVSPLPFPSEAFQATGETATA